MVEDNSSSSRKHCSNTNLNVHIVFRAECLNFGIKEDKWIAAMPKCQQNIQSNNNRQEQAASLNKCLPLSKHICCGKGNNFLQLLFKISACNCRNMNYPQRSIHTYHFRNGILKSWASKCPETEVITTATFCRSQRNKDYSLSEPKKCLKPSAHSGLLR